ncbi:MAG: hypothetical protein WB439_06000, partial [Acidobacteriaceae bacterium]
MKLPSRRCGRPNHKMRHAHNLRGRIIRPFSWLLFAAAAAGISAQTLPATTPTSVPGQATPGAAQILPAPPNAPHHAEVTFANGELQVRADNSSLNQILRSISHRTGLKITGGVVDQRVFGNYGPGPMSTVLSTLLDGTGTDILLLGGNANTPPKLILTPRNGRPEPPGPDSPTYAMYDDDSDRQSPVAPLRSSEVTQPPPQSPIVSPAGSPTRSQAQPETPHPTPT